MSKRKKTTTSKNTQPKLTKAQLTRKINALDQIELGKLAGQTGIIGAAFRINYHEVDGTYNKKEATCSKCIQPMEKLLAFAERYQLVDNEGDDKALINSVGVLAKKIFSDEVFVSEESINHLNLAEKVDILFTMLMAHIFSMDDVINYCEENKNGSVGILVIFNVKHNVETNDYKTELSIKSIDDLKEWMIASNELVAEDKATILRG